MLGYVMLDNVTLCQVRLGQVRLEQVSMQDLANFWLEGREGIPLFEEYKREFTTLTLHFVQTQIKCRE